jgi:hypothetical protein
MEFLWIWGQRKFTRHIDDNADAQYQCSLPPISAGI